MTAHTKDGGPAFPQIESALAYDHSAESYYTNTMSVGGMTLRDYFAAKALPAVVAAYIEASGRCIGTDHIHHNCAAHAFKMADAMLKAREQRHD